MMKIDLESHYTTDAWIEALTNNPGYPRLENGGVRFSPEVFSALVIKTEMLDMGEGRIAAMDRAGIDFSYLSHSYGIESLDPEVGTQVAETGNNRLSGAIARYPDRLGGWAALAPRDVDHAVRELERCVKVLGFRGWNAHSNFGDSYLDDPKYWPILAKAEELDVPIYLHPTVPRIPQLCELGLVLAGPTFGFGVEVAYVFMRMIVRGVFDRYPNLKIIMGHYGEALPFLIDRVDAAYRQHKSAPNPQFGPGSKRKASEYIRSNLWVTSSGNYFEPAHVCARAGLGPERIMLGSDYPFEKMDTCTEFLAALDLPGDELALFCDGNARALGLAPGGRG